MTTTRRPSAGAILLVLAAGTAAFAMLQSLITPVLATIQSELNTTQSTVTWVLTANLLSAAIFTPIIGRIGDSIGKKRALVIVLLALVAGSLIAALATSIGVLIAARVVQGAAGAVFPLAYGIIRDEFPAARVASGVGAISAIIAASGGLGIVLAGPIVTGLGYSWLFWIPMILAILATAAAYLFVPESPVRQPGRINWLAAGLLASWLVLLLLGVSRAPVWGWTSTQVVALIAGAAVLLVAWIATELRSRTPLIDMRMMRLPTLWTTNLAALLFGAGQFAMFAFLPQFVQTPTYAGYGFGSSVTAAGPLILPMLITMFVGGMASGRLEPIFGSKAQLAGGSALSVVAFAGLAFFHDERWQIGVATGVFELGIGLAVSAMTNLIVTGVPSSQTGAATGMNANFRTIGGALGTAVVGSVITSNLQGNGVPAETGYATGFGVLSVISIAAVAAALLVPSVRQRNSATAASKAESRSAANSSSVKTGVRT
ncbi:MFS transporter [Kribbella sp. NBC_01245]|uniref:MFS transporter n=1 Tax=Kribbella sp. NBC_01245 TaxID=2903578 RepID=UPI002E2D6196|nr:MFS transporter [Kribbella sp. NBC_01245]